MRSLLLCILAVIGLRLQAADTVRICAYNTLKYSAANEDGRIPKFARIMDSIRPDILICEEVEDASLGPRFITDVLTYAPFASSQFTDGPDSDCMLLYDQQKFSLIDTRYIATELRNIAEYTLETIPSNGLRPDTLVIYGMHLKASDDAPSIAQRQREVRTLMQNITTHSYVVLCGDFNIYGPTEASYVDLTGTSATRRFVDPLGSAWKRNSTEWLRYYTQATRSNGDGACGGGVGGGLDDRFDYILLSEALAPRHVNGSYRAFGNDGLDRRNGTIVDPPNTAVPQEMAEDLRCASDHLPIVCRLVLGDVGASVDEERVAAPSISVDSNRLTLRGLTAGRTYSILDVRGRTLIAHYVKTSVETWDISRLSNGSYVLHDGHAGTVFTVVR